MNVFVITEVIVIILIIISFFILSYRIDKYLDKTNQEINHNGFDDSSKLETIALTIVVVFCPIVNVVTLSILLCGFDLIIEYAESNDFIIHKEE